MRRRYLLPLLPLAALIFISASWATASKTPYALKGEVYASGFKIEMQSRSGARLKQVKAGTYAIKIEDKATIHNFHLLGPGVNRSTSISGTGERVWTVTLKRGTYRYFCDPHASSMRGSFRVV